MIVHKNTKGFTLLEILLVIAAIGILAAIVIIAINPQRQLAQVRDTTRLNDVNLLNKALEQYLIDEGSYPESISGIYSEICATDDLSSEDTLGVIDCTGLLDLRVLVPKYIASIPADPASQGSRSGYEVAIHPANNRISISSLNGEAELGSNIFESVPELITDGLVIRADASDETSYPGTGNTWFDISGSNRNGTINGASFQSTDPKNFSFNGTSNTISYSSYDFGNEFSFGFWVNPSSRTNIHTFIANTESGGSSNGFKVFMNTWNTNDRIIRVETGNGALTASTFTPSNTMISGQWQYVFVSISRITSTASIYLNGSLVTSGSVRPDFNTNSSYLIGSMTNDNWYFQGGMGQFHVYNRILGSSEVLNNFEATREYFGL